MKGLRIMVLGNSPFEMLLKVFAWHAGQNIQHKPSSAMRVCSLAGWVVCLALVPGAVAQQQSPAALGGLKINYITGTQNTLPPDKPIMPRMSTPPLDLGQSVIDPASGLTWRRISDWKEIGLQFSNNPTSLSVRRGYTNAYSKYPASNITGEYVIALGTEPRLSGLYRLNPRQLLGPVYYQAGGSKTGIAEGSNLRWDNSGRPGYETTVYYTTSSYLWKQDVLKGVGSETRVWRIPEDLRLAYPGIYIASEDHMDQGGIYRPVRVRCDSSTGTLYSKTFVINLETGKELPAQLPYAGSVMDTSQSGRWILINTNYYSLNGARFYDTRKLERGIVDPIALNARVGHDGWAYDKAGNEVFLFQDNGNDMFSTFNPETGERIDLFNMAETGWYLAQHPMRVLNPEARGWAFFSSYIPDRRLNDSWAYGQLFAVEIKDRTQKPRIWRLGTTQTQWDTDKNAWYFCESWANLSQDAQKIWIGSNWGGTTNLELHEITLPTRWWKILATGASPEPTPVPTPTATPGGGTPTPTPTPTATQTPIPVAGRYELKVLHTNRTGEMNNTQGRETAAYIGDRAIEIIGWINGCSDQWAASRGLFGGEPNIGILMAFDLSSVRGPLIRATLRVRTNYALQRYQANGAERMPVRAVLSSQRWQGPYGGSDGTTWGASWWYLSRDPIIKWSDQPTQERWGVTGDLSTVLEPITSDTAEMNWPLRANYWCEVDVTKAVGKMLSGQWPAWGFYISPTHLRQACTPYPTGDFRTFSSGFYGSQASNMDYRPTLIVECQP